MRYSINERVRVINKNELGIITEIEIKKVINSKGENETIRYTVKRDGFSVTTMYNENEIESLLEIAPDKLRLINDVLINANLKHGNYEIVKQLAEENRSVN